VEEAIFKYKFENFDIDYNKGFKIEELPGLDFIKPNRYVLFLYGGWHPFVRVSKEITDLPEIYRKQVWPWVASMPENKDYVNHLSPYINGHGYCVFKLDTINFHKNGDTKGFESYMHILVAKACVENPKNKKLVDHIDGNYTNYLPTNLQWATPSENSEGMKYGKFKIDRHFLRLQNKEWWTDPAYTIGMVKNYEDKIIKAKPTPQLSLELTFKDDETK
jgi:hypothetical protein